MIKRNSTFITHRTHIANIRIRILNITIGLGALWFSGFLLYCVAIPSMVMDAKTKTDGIVVLTGGAERLVVGINLLKQGMGHELLVSGVAEGVNKPAILQTLNFQQQPSPTLLDCCITLGHEALSTADNAKESYRWLSSRQMQSLRLVTANYHINRSLLEFRRIMPEIRIIAHPVFPEEVLNPYWFIHPSTLWLLINEYHKTLVAFCRINLSKIIEEKNWRWTNLRNWIN